MGTDVATKAAVAKLLLVAGVVMAAIATWSSWQQLQLIQDVAGGLEVSDEALIASDDRQGLLGILQTALGIVVAIAFLVWLRAVTRRLQELGVTGLKHAPKWAIWGFIIPILNLFRPHQVMSEVWKASEIAPGPEDPWSAKPTPAIVHLWWGVLLIENVVGQFLFRTTFRAETLDEILQLATTTVVADALGIVSAFLAYRLVTAIDARLAASEARLADRVAIAPAVTT